MTLLELTMVVLVLLALVSILFVGARAWVRGADRSENIMLIRNTQQAMRGHQNMNDVKESDVSDQTPRATFNVTTLSAYMKIPVPPNSDIHYNPRSFVTPKSDGITYNHIWLNPNQAGSVFGSYGHIELQDSDGW
jgi:type II secretory pathway pseudopilin PulG